MPSKSQKKAKKAAAAAAADPFVNLSPPENFKQVITDMCADLSTTFPEFKDQWVRWTAESLAAMDPEARDQELRSLFHHCTTVFPERFFDILYKNGDMFKTDSTVNTQFLPAVDFKQLFQCEGVSENTSTALWNYLQLVLFTVLGSVNDKSKFGDTKNLFDGIDETELFTKLSDTMNNISNFFMKTEGGGEEGEDGEDSSEKGEEGEGKAEEGSEDGDAKTKSEEDGEGNPFFSKMPKMPNLEELHNHLKGLFDGKIGKMAKELAEELSGDLSSILGEDGQNVASTQEALKQLLKNPAKLSKLVQTVGDKLKKKMSSGEVSQEELMKEASDLMNKMKSMGGGADVFKDMFKNMGVPMPKNARMDTNALNRMTQQHSTRERLKARMLQKKAAEAEAYIKAAQQKAAATGDSAPLDLEALSKSLGLDLGETMKTGSGGKKKSKK